MDYKNETQNAANAQTEFDAFLNDFSRTVSQLTEIRSIIGEKVRMIKNLTVPEAISDQNKRPEPSGAIEQAHSVLANLKDDLYRFEVIKDQLCRIV